MTSIIFLRSSVNSIPDFLNFGTPAWSDVNGDKKFFIGDTNNKPYLISDSSASILKEGNAIKIDELTDPPTISVLYNINNLSLNTNNELYVSKIIGENF